MFLPEPNKTRSPLPEVVPSSAGQSSTLEFFRLLTDILALLVAPLCVLGIALIEWMHDLFRVRPHPFVATIAFVAVSGTALTRGRRLWRQLERLGLGIRGERAVGHVLEKLRAHGYHVFHDLVEDGYNIDHVLIGPAGVFSIETKTRSKPRCGDARVVVDGQRLTVAGFEPDRDPIAQAEAAARRVRAILLARTGREVPCTPVVLFPGWWVEIRKPPASVFVMNAKYFAQWIPDRPKRLLPNDITFLAAGMERYLEEQRTN